MIIHNNITLPDRVITKIQQYVDAYALVDRVSANDNIDCTSDNRLSELMDKRGDVAVADPDTNLRWLDDSSIVRELIHHLAGLDLGFSSITPSGRFYYPPGGYMGWHTNSDAPFNRLYIVYASESGRSFFKYYDQTTKEVVTCYDKKGINVYTFTTPEAPNLFWHCVGSDCHRFSFGYRLTMPKVKK